MNNHLKKYLHNRWGDEKWVKNCGEKWKIFLHPLTSVSFHWVVSWPCLIEKTKKKIEIDSLASINIKNDFSATRKWHTKLFIAEKERRKEKKEKMSRWKLSLIMFCNNVKRMHEVIIEIARRKISFQGEKKDENESTWK